MSHMEGARPCIGSGRPRSDQAGAATSGQAQAHTCVCRITYGLQGAWGRWQLQARAHCGGGRRGGGGSFSDQGVVLHPASAERVYAGAVLLLWGHAHLQPGTRSGTDVGMHCTRMALPCGHPHEVQAQAAVHPACCDPAGSSLPGMVYHCWSMVGQQCSLCTAARLLTPLRAGRDDPISLYCTACTITRRCVSFRHGSGSIRHQSDDQGMAALECTPKRHVSNS